MVPVYYQNQLLGFFGPASVQQVILAVNGVIDEFSVFAGHNLGKNAQLHVTGDHRAIGRKFRKDIGGIDFYKAVFRRAVIDLQVHVIGILNGVDLIFDLIIVCKQIAVEF